MSSIAEPSRKKEKSKKSSLAVDANPATASVDVSDEKPSKKHKRKRALDDTGVDNVQDVVEAPKEKKKKQKHRKEAIAADESTPAVTPEVVMEDVPSAVDAPKPKKSKKDKKEKRAKEQAADLSSSKVCQLFL